jgi:hypothetical protein
MTPMEEYTQWGSTDITERKKMEDSLKAADKFFNMSLDIMVMLRMINL